MSDEEYEYDIDDISSNNETDEELDIIDDELILTNIEDTNVFRKNYDNLKKNNVSSLYLNKYEVTKILSKRCEQLENGSLPLISDYSMYNNVYDIAVVELKEKKIPFILKRLINNKYEYWKLSDLNF